MVSSVYLTGNGINSIDNKTGMVTLQVLLSNVNPISRQFSRIELKNILAKFGVQVALSLSELQTHSYIRISISTYLVKKLILRL